MDFDGPTAQVHDPDLRYTGSGVAGELDVAVVAQSSVGSTRSSTSLGVGSEFS